MTSASPPHDAPGSQRGAGLAQALLAVLILVVGGLLARFVLSSRSVPELEATPPAPPLVHTLSVQPSETRMDVISYGTVRPRTESVLSAEVSGRVVWIAEHFEAGSFFAAGDELLRIDPRDYEFAIVRAEAAVARAQLAVATEENEARVALEEWTQIGEGEPDPLVLREPQLAEARAAVSAARADLEQARIDLERTTVRAPYDGRVRHRDVDPGEYVAIATNLGRVYATDVVELVLPVPRHEVGFLDMPLGRAAHSVPEHWPAVTFATDFGGRHWTWEGRVVRTEGVISERTRSVRLVARIEAPYAIDEPGRPPLVPGMFLDAQIRGRVVSDALVVPRTALRADDVLLIVDDDERLRMRSVTPLRLERERVIVAAGLLPGERVCVSIVDAATDGMAVRAEPAPTTPHASRDP